MLLVSALVLSILVYLLLARRKRVLPGPNPIPLIGNILHLPTKSAWLKLLEWKEQYGGTNAKRPSSI